MFIKKVLPNGLRIVTEKIPHVQSVAVGIWVATGSRNENIDNNGVSHFIEHMLFKGTQTKTAKQIAQTIENIGGQINAFTGKECTCFYTKTLNTHINIAFDVLSDMFFNSKFDNNDINLEKSVILEEINMYEDTPEELVHDVLNQTIWKDALGYPILGNHDTVNKLNQDKMKQYFNKYYTPTNTVIAIAGDFDDDNLDTLISKYFAPWNSNITNNMNYEKSIYVSDITLREKDSEQSHLAISFEAFEQQHELLYATLIVNNVFGGGMSSRLFQAIREEKGLAYAIYSFPTAYQKEGIFSIYGGTNPDNAEEVIKLILKEVDVLVKHKLTKQEIYDSKEQLKGNYILGLESTSGRMSNIGKSELLMNKIYSPEEILEKIDNVNSAMVEQVINTVFNREKMALSIVGAIPDIDFKKII